MEEQTYIVVKIIQFPRLTSNPYTVLSVMPVDVPREANFSNIICVVGKLSEAETTVKNKN